MTLAMRVADQLREMITSGEWQVGTRIPAEHDLVERFGVSRNTVREALRSLVHAQLLEARVGDGTYVLSASELEYPLVTRAARGDLANTFEVRAILEQQAARLAASRRTADDVAALRHLLAERREAEVAGDHGRYVAVDAAFHKAVVAAAHNDLLTEVYDHLGTALAVSIASGRQDDGVAEEHRKHHERLFAAIADGNPNAAERAAAALISRARR